MSDFGETGESSGTEMWCRLEVGERSCCVPASQVLEVTTLPPITPFPNAPPSLIGIADLRGAAVPIVDLSIGDADAQSRDKTDFKYVAITRVTLGGEETLLGLAAHGVQHTGAGDANSNGEADLVDVSVVAEALRAAVAR